MIIGTIIMKKKNVLIIGGTSGLGFAMAQLLHNTGYCVFITGRKNPHDTNLIYLDLYIDEKTTILLKNLNRIVNMVGTINLLVYAAGFPQIGNISDMNDDSILSMVNTGLLAPAMLIQRILRNQKTLSGFIAITSTSQWIPREKEPVYAAVKAGIAMLANSISLDQRVKKTLVVGPAGMNTKFWLDIKKLIEGTLLDSKWVAEKTLELYNENFNYRLIRILRDPPRIQIIEQR